MPKNKKLQLLIEKHIVLEDIDPVIFYGVGNGHLQMIRSLYPKLRIMARDNVIRVLGDEEQMAAFEESVEKLRAHDVPAYAEVDAGYFEEKEVSLVLALLAQSLKARKFLLARLFLFVVIDRTIVPLTRFVYFRE